VNELAEGLVLDGVELHEPRLLTGLNTDFDTAKSWMAVAWYPILCHSTTAHAIKGSFITYHRFRFLDEGSKMRGAEEESGGSREEGGGGQAEGGAVGLEGMVKEVVGRMVDEAGQRAGAAMSSREAGAAAVSVAEDGTPLGEALPLEMSGYVHYKVVNVTWYAPRNRPGGMSSASNFVVPVYLFELAAVHSRTLCGFRTEDGDEGMHGGGEATVLRRGPHRDFEHIMAKVCIASHPSSSSSFPLPRFPLVSLPFNSSSLPLTLSSTTCLPILPPHHHHLSLSPKPLPSPLSIFFIHPFIHPPTPLHSSLSRRLTNAPNPLFPSSSPTLRRFSTSFQSREQTARRWLAAQSLGGEGGTRVRVRPSLPGVGGGRHLAASLVGKECARLGVCQAAQAKSRDSRGQAIAPRLILSRARALVSRL
jgi:hypothetical protein